MNSTRYHYSHGLRASGQDLESIDALEDYIDRSQVIMIFVSKGYFLSTNCLREARTAVAKAKPLALVHDPVRGGATLETIKANECPLELQGIFKDHKIIEWHRIKVPTPKPTPRNPLNLCRCATPPLAPSQYTPHDSQDFQVVSLKLLASELLLACPGYDTQYRASYYEDRGGDRKQEKTLYSDIHVPGEITEATLKLLTDVRIYTSPDNPGAREVAEILQKQIKGLQLSAVPPPAMGTHFLLYLAHETFVGEAGERLAEEVRRMTRTNQPIVMLHENDMANGGCEFARFFSTTPQDLIADGLYKALALAYYPGHFRPVSIALVAKRLGAAANRQGLRAWRSSLNLSSSKRDMEVAHVAAPLGKASSSSTVESAGATTPAQV